MIEKKYGKNNCPAIHCLHNHNNNKQERNVKTSIPDICDCTQKTTASGKHYDSISYNN